MANAQMDILISAVDKASGVMENIEVAGESTAQSLETSFLAVAGAITAVTIASEALYRKQAEMLNTLEDVAWIIGSQSNELRELAVGISNVTRPVDEVVESFELMQQRGIENEHQMALLAITYDTLADSIGSNLPETLKQTSRLLGVFGESIASVTENQDKLTFLFRRTPTELKDMNTMLRQGSGFIRDFNLSLDDGVVLLATLSRQAGDGKTAVREFRRATRSAKGDLSLLYEELDITEEQLADMRKEMEDSAGITEELAENYADSFTIIQKLDSILDRLKLRYAEVLEVGSLLGPVILGIVVALASMFIIVPKVTAGVVGFIGALKSLAIGLTMTKALILAIPVAIALAVENMTDESKKLSKEVDRLGQATSTYGDILSDMNNLDISFSDAVSRQGPEAEKHLRDLRGEVGDFLIDLRDTGKISEKEFERIANSMENADDVFKVLDDEDLLIEFGKKLNSSVMEASKNLKESDPGGIVSKAISGGLDKALDLVKNKSKDWASSIGDSLHGALDNLDEALFGDMDLDETTLQEIINDIRDNTEDETEDTTKSISDFINMTDEQISAIDALEGKYKDLGVEYDSNIEKAEVYSKTIRNMLSNDIKPTEKALTNYVDSLINVAKNTEDTEQANKLLEDTFISLVSNGLDPADEHGAKILDTFKSFEDGMGNVSSSGKTAQEVFQALQDNIESLELKQQVLAGSNTEVAESFDLESEKLGVLTAGLSELTRYGTDASTEIKQVVEDIQEIESQKPSEASKIFQEMQGNLKNLEKQHELVTGEMSFLGEEFDLNEAKMQEYRETLNELLNLEEDHPELIALIIAKMSELDGEMDSTMESLDSLSLAFEKAELMNDKLGDSYNKHSEQANIARTAIDKLMETQTIQGELTEEQADELDKWMQRWVSATSKIDNVNSNLANMYNNIQNIENVGEVLEWGDIDTRQFNEVERIIQTMIEEEKEFIELEDGRKITLEEMIVLRENLNNETAEQESLWGNVFDTIRSKLPILDTMLGKIEEMSGINISEKVTEKIEGALDKIGITTLGGPIGAVIEIFGSLISQSETFSEIMEVGNEIFEALANTVGMLLEPLVPLVTLLSSTLLPVFKSLGIILSSVLEPVFRMLFPVIQLAGLGLNRLAKVLLIVRKTFLQVMLALAKGIDKIPFVSASGAIKSLESSIAKVSDSMDGLDGSYNELKDMTYDNANAKKDEEDASKGVADANKNVSEELLNVPTGYKLALNRFDSMSDEAMNVMDGREQQKNITSTGVHSNQPKSTSNDSDTNKLLKQVIDLLKNNSDVTINKVEINGIDDPVSIWRKLKEVMKNERFSNTGTIVEVGSKY